MQAVLRTATAEDNLAVAKVLISSREAFMPYAPSAHSHSEVHQWVGSTLIPTRRVTVACVAEFIVGVLATSEAEGTSWVDQLYVLPAYVGKGIGSLLLEHGLELLPRPVRLYTFQANAGARRFYERHGFTAIVFTDGSANEEHCPDVLFELAESDENAA